MAEIQNDATDLPREGVPNARTLTTAGGGIRDAIATCCGKAVVTFALAEIAILQADSNLYEEMPTFYGSDGCANAERPWQTFDNLISDEPDKAVTQPITVMIDVKLGLTVFLLAVANLCDEAGKLPADDPLGHLASAPWREANVVRLMVGVTARAAHLLRADPLCRDLGYPLTFCQKFNALVTSKANVDPGANAIVRLFLDFIKVVAWHAAVRAYEYQHLTLNRLTFFSIIASMEACLPEAEAPVVRDVLNFVRSQVECWEMTVKRAALEKRLAKAAKPAVAAKTAAKTATAAANTATAAAKPAASAKTAAPADAAAPATVTSVAAATPAPAAKTTALTKAATPVTKPTPAANTTPLTKAANTPAAKTVAPATPAAPELEYDDLIADNDAESVL